MAVVALTTLSFGTSAALAQGPPDGVPPQPGVDVPPERPGPFFVPPGLEEEDVDEEDEGAIAGTVTDAADDGGIEDATVTVEGPTDADATTDADGGYALDELEVGDYDVTVTADGYETADASGIAVDDGITTTLNFTLDPAAPVTGAIAGTVTDAADDAGIEDATVMVQGPTDADATTDADGGYVLDELEVGDYDVTVTADGYETADASGIAVDDGITTTLNFTLDAVEVEGGTYVAVYDLSEGSGSTVELPFAGEVDVEVDWGDGTVEQYDEESPTHTYDEQEEFTVEVTGTFESLSAGFSTDGQDSLISVDEWSDTATVRAGNAFRDAENLESVATPPHTITTMNAMFRNAESFNEDLDDWNTSNVEDMDQMFWSADAFNGNIGDWDTSNVERMFAMFQGADAFDRDLNGWDTGNVTTMRDMFLGAESFDGGIGDWDTGNVQHMGSMFQDAESFDQDLNDWDTSNVENMQQMFWEAREFDGAIGDWDTGNVENMREMFWDARVFNRDIGGWDTSNVEDMTGMFRDAREFDQDLNDWDTSNVDSMWDMFYRAHAFNGAIGGWDTGNVVSMERMFSDAREFDRDIGDWDTSNVDNMQEMFGLSEDNTILFATGASSFDQDISEWDTSNVEDMTRMFSDAETFNQDLSPWCVEDIESQPDGFALGADEWEEPQPDWGVEC